MMLESLNSAEFQQLTDDDSRAVLGGLAAAAARITGPENCLLDGQLIKDYTTDPDPVVVVVIIYDEVR